MAKIKIYSIHKEGGADEEYVLLQTTEDVNIGNYAIMDNTFDDEGRLSNIYRHFFRFPSKMVKKGEFVALFTGKGTPYVGKMEYGEPVYVYYWGSKAPIWNDDDIDKAALIYVATIDTKAA